MIATNKNWMLMFAAGIAALGSIVILTGCGTTSAAEQRPAKQLGTPDAAVREVRTTPATGGDVDELIIRTATLASPNTVSVLPKIAGQIVELNVEEGSAVKAGQLIARIDAPQLELASEKMRAVRDKAMHDLDLATRQINAQVINKEDFLQVKHLEEQSERDYQQSLIELEKARVLSPIDGIVARRAVSVGDMVFSGSTIVTITDPNRLEADVFVPQDQVDRVRVGNQAILFPNGDEKRPIRGAVERLSPVIETDTGTVKVTVLVTPGQRDVLPGQFVKVHLITGIVRNAVLVPREAVVVENAMNVLYKVTADGYAKRVPVALGSSKEGRVQVIGEIATGDPVVVVGLNGLDDMIRVKVLGDAVAE